MAMPIETNLRLQNDAKALDENRWEWSVWVEGAPQELDQVECVTYRLHPTFPQPIRRVEDRTSGFRLRATGWGEFTIAADARLKDGRNVRLEKWLELRDPSLPPDAAEAGKEKPKVFISHSIADNAIVSALREALERQGVDVWTDQSIEGASDSATEIRERLLAADAVVPVISEPRSRFVEQEAKFAKDEGRIMLPVVLGAAELSGPFSHVAHFVLHDSANVGALADRIVAQVKEAMPETEA
jgi:pYEATS domain-containing protein involved in immunity/TIR domain-containing protein